MAKADLEIPFNGIHGSLDSESEIYYANRLGETVISHYPKHKDPKKITAHQHDHNNHFRQAVSQAKIERPPTAAPIGKNNSTINPRTKSNTKPYKLL